MRKLRLAAMVLKDFKKSLVLLVILQTSAKDEEGWQMKAPSEVRAIEGYPAVLPCSFTHPHHTHPASMHVSWTLGHGRAATLLFRCSSLNNSHQCQSKSSQDPRYRLEGNHRNHDISLRINSVTLGDSGRYYCHVELPGHGHTSFENTLGTRLRVEAPPQILSLSAKGNEELGFKAVCHVQGSPLPDLQWISSNGVLDGDTAFTLSEDSTGQYRTSSQLLEVQPGGHYICTASNSMGKDQATLYLLHPSPETPSTNTSNSIILLLLAVALGTKLILALGLGAWAIKRIFNVRANNTEH